MQAVADTDSEASDAALSQVEWDLREATSCDTPVFYRVLRKGETLQKLRRSASGIQGHALERTEIGAPGSARVWLRTKEKSVLSLHGALGKGQGPVA